MRFPCRAPAPTRGPVEDPSLAPQRPFTQFPNGPLRSGKPLRGGCRLLSRLFIPRWPLASWLMSPNCWSASSDPSRSGCRSGVASLHSRDAGPCPAAQDESRAEANIVGDMSRVRLAPGHGGGRIVIIVKDDHCETPLAGSPIIRDNIRSCHEMVFGANRGPCPGCPISSESQPAPGRVGFVVPSIRYGLVRFRPGRGRLP
jgi:hypothetical protein